MGILGKRIRKLGCHLKKVELYSLWKLAKLSEILYDTSCILKSLTNTRPPTAAVVV